MSWFVVSDEPVLTSVVYRILRHGPVSCCHQARTRTLRLVQMSSSQRPSRLPGAALSAGWEICLRLDIRHSARGGPSVTFTHKCTGAPVPRDEPDFSGLRAPPSKRAAHPRRVPNHAQKSVNLDPSALDVHFFDILHQRFPEQLCEGFHFVGCLAGLSAVTTSAEIIAHVQARPSESFDPDRQLLHSQSSK